MDFEDPEARKAAQAMIAEAEGNSCVNFGEYDGEVYVCRRLSGLEVNEDGCLYGTRVWVDPEDARPGELTDGMAPAPGVGHVGHVARALGAHAMKYDQGLPTVHNTL